MAGQESIHVVANRLRDELGCCSDPFERFSAERVERATGIPSADVHLIAQGMVEPDADDAERLRLLDQAMRNVQPAEGATFEQWLLLRPADALAAPAILIRDLRRGELAALLA